MISDADLNAYLDGELPEARRLEVEQLLAAHPEAAEQLRAYRAQQRTLRENFDAVLDEPLPARLRAAALGQGTSLGPVAVPRTDAALERDAARGHGADRWRRFAPGWRLAAAVLLAVGAGVLGWTARGLYQPSNSMAVLDRLPRQAALAHAVFSPDVRRPVEVTAEHEDQLVTWLSRRLGTPVKPPALGAASYELVGGRLLPGDSGPVAQFMYQDSSGQRLTLYVTRDIQGNRQTAFRFAREGPVNVFYWIDGAFGYALSGGVSRDELSRVATAVYDQLERKSLEKN